MKERKARAGLPSQMLGAALLLTVTVAVLWFGSVTPYARAVLHGLVAVCLGLAMVQPESVIARSGASVRLGCASLLPILAVGLGVFHAIEPERVGSTLGGWVAVIGITVAAGVFGGSRGVQRATHIGVLALATILLVLGLTSASLGTGYLGSTGIQFAPLVNANHYGTLMLLVYPFVLVPLLSKESLRVYKPWCLALVAVIWGAVFWTGSVAPLGLLGVETIFAFVVTRRLSWVAGVALVVAGAVGLMAIGVWVGHGERGLLNGRIPAWLSTLQMWKDHFFLGTGAGTFEIAFPPYRADSTDESWPFAHNDLLEWVAETGLVGFLLLGVAVIWGRPRVHRRGVRNRMIGVALAGFCLHALIDFPFHIPGLALMVGALWGWRTGTFDKRPDVRSWLARGALGVGVGAQLVGVGWFVHRAFIDEALHSVEQTRSGTLQRAAAVEALAALDPDAAPVLLERVLTALKNDRPDVAQQEMELLHQTHGHRGSVNMALAQLSLAIRQEDKGLAYADRAVQLAPFDKRLWLARARIYERVDVQKSLPAWAEVIRRRSHQGLADAWRVMPLGIYWVTALEGADAAVFEQLGRFLVRKKDYESAMLAFEVARRDQPGQWYLEEASALVAMNDPRADAYFRAALSVDPTHSKLLSVYAEFLSKQERHDDAVSVWKSLADAVPKHRVRWIQAVKASKGPEAAIRALNLVEASGWGGDSALVLERARLYAEMGDRSRCMVALTGTFTKRQQAAVRALRRRCQSL